MSEPRAPSPTDVLAALLPLLGQPRGEEELAQAVATTLSVLLDARGAGVFQLDRSTRTLVTCALSGSLAGLGRLAVDVRSAPASSTMPAVSRRHAALTDALQTALLGRGHDNVLAVPLAVGDDPIGAIALVGDGSRWSADAVALTQSFADAAAIVLRNAEVFGRELAARTAAQSLAFFAEMNPAPLLRFDRAGTIVTANPAAMRLLGATVSGTPLRALIPEIESLDLERCIRTGSIVSVTATIADRVFQFVVRGLPELHLGHIYGSDITELRRAQSALFESEERLRQSQKMEAVGRLAGGVAHDFNNLLTVITGRAQLVLRRLPPADPLRRHVELIQATSARAVTLTRQLLAFGRKQVLQPRVLDLNTKLRELEAMLRHLIAENVTIRLRLVPGAALTRADPGQIDQVILNLSINAADAMPRGGTLTLQTAHATADAEFLRRHPDADGTDFVTLSVVDTGAGMDEETRTRIFEPFFTTKELGKGTGLGLAVVHGIITQHRGHIDIDSGPGVGSRFIVYLPASEPSADGDVGDARVRPAPAAPGTRILLLEDEPEVRALIHELLEEGGYQVVEATTAEEAETLVRQGASPIHLLLTDVVMPETSGPDLAAKLITLQPDLKVLYMSGYPMNVLGSHGALEASTHLLAKPFTREALEQKIRDVLNAPR